MLAMIDHQYPIGATLMCVVQNLFDWFMAGNNRLTLEFSPYILNLRQQILQQSLRLLFIDESTNF